MMQLSSILLAAAVLSAALPRVSVDLDAALHAPFGLDIDDDLALAYLSRTSIVEHVTTTHGNTLARWSCQAAQVTVDELIFERPSTEPSKEGEAFLPNDEVERAALLEQRRLQAEAKLGPPKVHCGGGWWGQPYPYAAARIARMHPSSTVLALGALTNVGAALARGKQLRSVVFVGGYFEPGNKSLVELNVLADGRALQQVLSAPRVPKTVLPVNLLRQVVLTASDFAPGFFTGWTASHLDTITAHARRMALLNQWLFGPPSDSPLAGFHPLDVAAAVFVTHPELFGGFKCHPAAVEWRFGLVPVLALDWGGGHEATSCEDWVGHVLAPHRIDADRVREEILRGLKLAVRKRLE